MGLHKGPLLGTYIVAFFLVLGAAHISFASTTDGTIDATQKYAWGNRVGWVNFGTSGGDVHVTDSAVTGYAWSENYGWINLSPSQSGVVNNSEGVLSGYAWGEKLGWINFSGVSVSSAGVFSGTAVVSSTHFGSISFDCTNCGVVTDWRPASVRGGSGSSGTTGGNSGGGGGGTGYYVSSPYPAITSSTPRQPTEFPAPPPYNPETGITPPVISPSTPPAGGGIISQIPQRLLSVFDRVKDFMGNLFFPKPQPLKPPDIAKIVSQKAPFAFGGRWDLISAKEMGAFVLAPLPKEFAALVKKFPSFKETLNQVSVSRMTDIQKLVNVKLSLPGLSESAGIQPVALPGGISGGTGMPSAGLEPGRFALPPGIPIANMEVKFKQQIPKEIVFARSGGEKIDFPIGLVLNKQGVLEKRIRTVVGSTLNLSVKPGAPALSVKGYLVLKTRLPQEKMSVKSGAPGGLVASVAGKLLAGLAAVVSAPEAPSTSSALGQNAAQETGVPLQKLSASVFFAAPDFAVPAKTTSYIVDPIKGGIPTEFPAGASTGTASIGGVDPTRGREGSQRASASNGVDAKKMLAEVAQVVQPSQTVSNEGGNLPQESVVSGAAGASGKTGDQQYALMEFDYTDPDGDGIYTATITAPRVDGEYNIITLISYKDPDLGTREIRLITVIDPEGYVFEKQGNKEARIPGAIVSLYALNPSTNKYETWPAREYHQENPQITDVRGTYAFLVPQGYYYIGVVAPGYGEYQGKPFEVSENNEVHFNIELQSKYGWLLVVDWKALLLIIVSILLIYNFYQDRKRQKTNNS